MGAEQSAYLACTQTGEPEKFLELINSDQFFRLHFENIPKPVTGPVTEALLYLVENLPNTKAPTVDAGVVNNADEDLNSIPDEDEDLEFSDDGESGFNSDFTSSTE